MDVAFWMRPAREFWRINDRTQCLLSAPAYCVPACGALFVHQTKTSESIGLFVVIEFGSYCRFVWQINCTRPVHLIHCKDLATALKTAHLSFG